MAGSAFSIRAAAAGDLESLLELYGHLNSSDPALSPAKAEERYAAMLAQPGMTVFIGFLGAVPTSTVTLIVVPNLTRNGAPYALIENVVTHGDHRKRGHAGALIRHAVNAAWETGCYKVMLLTGSKDPATLRFYENCGFTQDKTGYQIRR
ncbi:GNAT family N-acetyltransferase [Rhizobium grahamii]|uniref:GNAT family N-acetyltransferase n=1 Tax=Rhizobium grahamii TaxID=1120045 RepID=A0A5Q0CA94_9HYPH|nr:MULTISPECIES: GNAT family N-acetyltransferase [Rhizobium]QFY60781.1 GNAT family N-acetyltransferase [Rhizobium grahamii]QRM50074.1 GNAT family N-acetyltransferase [Rhizobium sp. BG6]